MLGRPLLILEAMYTTFGHDALIHILGQLWVMPNEKTLASQGSGTKCSATYNLADPVPLNVSMADRDA